MDRIGQKSDKIYCYSFLPEDGLETILDLRGRLQKRIKENAEAVGSDEVFFDGDPVNIKDLYNEKAGIFDEDEDGDVDLASYCYQIWKNGCDKHRFPFWRFNRRGGGTVNAKNRQRRNRLRKNRR